MNITAAELKSTLKKLAPVRTESYVFGDHGVSAQDADVWVVVPSPLSALGTFVVNGKKLGQVVNKTSGQIEIERGEKSLTLKWAKAKIELEAHSVKPLKLPTPPETNVSFLLPEFKKTLAIAVASASPNKGAAYGGVVQLQSLPLRLEENLSEGYRIVGTNGAVLTMATRIITDVVPEFSWLLNLPAAAVVQLMDSNVVDVGESDTHLYLSSGNLIVFASKPVQNYPRYDAILALPPKMKFGFKPEEWLASLRTVETLIDASVDGGGVVLHLENGVLQWIVSGSEGSAQDEAPYEQLEPDPVFEPVKVYNLKLIAKHVAEFLTKAGPEATMSLIDRTKPVTLQSGNVTALMMPIVGKVAK